MGRYIALGLILIAAGFAAAAAITVPRFLNVKEQIEGFPKTRLSEGSVQLERRAYDVYIDVPSGTGDVGWTLSVRDPQGREVTLRPSTSSITYDWSGREGSRIGKLRATVAGRHVVSGTGPPGADVVFADDVVGDMGRSLLWAFVVLLVFASAGTLALVLGFTRHRPREAKRWP